MRDVRQNTVPSYFIVIFGRKETHSHTHDNTPQNSAVIATCIAIEDSNMFTGYEDLSIESYKHFLYASSGSISGILKMAAENSTGTSVFTNEYRVVLQNKLIFVSTDVKT